MLEKLIYLSDSGKGWDVMVIMWGSPVLSGKTTELIGGFLQRIVTKKKGKEKNGRRGGLGESKHHCESR